MRRALGASKMTRTRREFREFWHLVRKDKIMQRKRKFLLWIPVLVLLCAAFTVFCAAADETAESTDSATFIFMKDGDAELMTQKYKLGDKTTFSFDLTATKKTCEINLHNFYAQFSDATFTKKKNGETESLTVEQLPTTISADDIDATYEIRLTGSDIRKVYASVSCPANNALAYLADADTL